jgi:hypothetical protein
MKMGYIWLWLCVDYKSLVKALEERFAPPNQTEL